MKIYVASSWRNLDQPGVVVLLRKLCHEVYDFRNPEPGDHGFNWGEVDPDWQKWSIEQYRNGLKHPLAESGFRKDMKALMEAEAVLLVMPCGRSAHLEMGYAVGAGKKTAILLHEMEPELMYKMADRVLGTTEELIEWAGKAIKSLPDWTRSCSTCGEAPVAPETGLCGPCTFGEASTAGGNW